MKKIKKLWVSEDFHSFFKLKAAENKMGIIEYSDKIVKNVNGDFPQSWSGCKPKKNEKKWEFNW